MPRDQRRSAVQNCIPVFSGHTAVNNHNSVIRLIMIWKSWQVICRTCKWNTTQENCCIQAKTCNDLCEIYLCSWDLLWYQYPFKCNIAICNSNASSSTWSVSNYAILKYASTMQTYLGDMVLEDLWEICIYDLSSNT